MNSALRTLPVVLIASGALFLGASGGAVAGSLITGKQIKDDTVTTKDIKDKTLRTQDLAPATLAALTGSTGAQGPKGDTGPVGPKGDTGAQGPAGLVRAWAYVSNGTVLRQSGGLTITNPSTGTYCVSAPGLSVLTSGYSLTPDFSADSTGGTNQSYAEAATGACSGGAFGIYSFVRTNGGAPSASNQEAFTIMIS